MSVSFNRVIIAGNLTRDPELKHISSYDTSVTDIGLAINERRRAANGATIDAVTFVDVTLFGRSAELAAEFLQKGSPALIEGRLRLDSWTTDGGQKRSKLKVIGDRIQFLGRKAAEQTQQSEQPSVAQEAKESTPF